MQSTLIHPAALQPDWSIADLDDQLMFFQMLHQGFQRAAQAAGFTQQFYQLGNATICLKFAGSGLIPKITPALSHLVVEPTQHPDLTICLWDSASTKTPLPSLIHTLTEMIQMNWVKYLGTRTELKDYDGDRIRSSFHIGPNILSVLDRQTNLACYWIEDADDIPYWEEGSPLQKILNLWTTDHQLQYVHAGAVGHPDGGVLIVGKGGSGKSSTALACLDSSLVYVSDDYCLASVEPRPYVYSLYNTAKLRGQADLERFPKLAPLVKNVDRSASEKAMLFLQESHPEKIVRGFPLKAILIPKVTGNLETDLVPTTAAAGLRALAPSTIAQLPGDASIALKTMAQLAQQVPCYYLNLGTDISQISTTISQLLDQL